MSYTTIEFPSADGLIITADEYLVEKPKGYIVLCHRSHFNRGEYRETALLFNELGFSCLAIDQRSGMQVLGVTNETYARAKEQGLKTGYYAAKPDIEVTIAFAYKRYGSKVILLGSSYSASLSLAIAAEDSSKIEAVIAFSPGEYFKNIHVAEAITNLRVPVFITSAKKEAADASAIVEYVDRQYVTQFIPFSEGSHGSRVLWRKSKEHEEYWTALTSFLDVIS